MRTTTGSVHSNPAKPTSQTYPPSVPMYVYRELAVELQATQAKLDALTAKNQQLVQENQLLRHEVSKVVQSFLHLQKLVGFDATPGSHQAQNSSFDGKSLNNHPAADTHPRQQFSRSRQPTVSQVSNSKSHRSDFSVPTMDINAPMPQTVLIEEQEVGYYPTTQAEAKEFNGWWLAFTILLIMLTAFAAGYLIVRPLFEYQSR
ncbi:hypothetical protein I8748_25630 [Nostoc sp. CENA67]|uniref:Uncharacterized protein n=1 Tax=Amazonocrinis nigriterrae CENA67 TaxID=2794033 RepID=A0A8J7HWB8_9NOST|nr:hypothetical protein [Amazonocrinis nigriterrae]MBH8565515.1 hypothetical protein [Amazonocrinis nigriterrae CENA67]